MGAAAFTLPLLGLAAMAAACRPPADPSPSADRSAEKESGAPAAGRSVEEQGGSPASSCAAPRHWRIASAQGHETVSNTISIDKAGTIHWNGVPIDAVRLRQYMDLVSTMVPTPRTLVKADPGAGCAGVAEVVRIVGNAVECERFCSYATAPFELPGPPPPSPAPPPKR